MAHDGDEIPVVQRIGLGILDPCPFSRQVRARPTPLSETLVGNISAIGCLASNAWRTQLSDGARQYPHAVTVLARPIETA